MALCPHAPIILRRMVFRKQELSEPYDTPQNKTQSQENISIIDHVQQTKKEKWHSLSGYPQNNCELETVKFESIPQPAKFTD